MPNIETNDLLVEVASKGAELKRLYHKGHAQDYLWTGDPAFWAKTSPVLFPIVGTLKENMYYHENTVYHLSRHGFAREKTFQLKEQTGTSLVFALEADEDTLQHYPFRFRFEIAYEVVEQTVKVSYRVHNTDSTVLFFSVGGHPAFRVPLSKGLQYEDYYLQFSEVEFAKRWPISAEGLIETSPQAMLNGNTTLQLTRELFNKDALVFKGLASHIVSLKSDKDPRGLSLDLTGFPYLGIWAVKNADFVCIEPWCGIADSVTSTQQLHQKEGIQSLQPGKTFERSWAITLF